VSGGNLLKAAAIGAVVGLGFTLLIRKMMREPVIPEYDVEQYDIGGPTTMDLGGRVPMTYDTGGRPNHRMVMVESGETIVSKTQNMVGGNEALGGVGGLSIYISGDVYDAENFAAKIGEVLPSSLTGATDIGSMDVRTSRFGSTFGKPVINRGRTITGGI
jgi:hypothetical protein